MNHEKICIWLGLPSGNWPPDHYSLLGLKPGEGDVASIEQRVHERLAKLRGYQLSHPEQATEAMNRLAQAFMCLTDPEARKCYDRSACPESGHVAEVKKPEQNGSSSTPACSTPGVSLPNVGSIDDTAVGKQTHVDWKSTPPPVRADVIPACPVVPDATGTGTMTASTPAPEVAPTPPVSQPADALYEFAHNSLEARRGLGTLSALIERIYHTRQLLWAWEQAGRFLHRPKCRPKRLSEQKDLTRRLQEIGELMDGFPAILGQPGQPGYRVLAMGRLAMTSAMFNMLDLRQREALARDWFAGRILLLGHRQFLHQQLKALRRRGLFSRLSHACRAALNDHPFGVLTGVVVIALLVALFHMI